MLSCARLDAAPAWDRDDARALPPGTGDLSDFFDDLGSHGLIAVGPADDHLAVDIPLAGLGGWIPTRAHGSGRNGRRRGR